MDLSKLDHAHLQGLLKPIATANPCYVDELNTANKLLFLLTLNDDGSYIAMLFSRTGIPVDELIAYLDKLEDLDILEKRLEDIAGVKMNRWFFK